ncbi:ABC transporter substrate-binding protein [Rhodococcus sp. 05-340-1]|uniref:heme/hemin ABC transporter substrate-binding protein n=1 Tax=Rhodococcus sp. NPDC006774 TaxID=3157186 RepID=UPI000B9B89AA|nr:MULTISPECIES: ABC transporter substrate-binding protein [unclassified Rhodococcus (in: high G+C Gram-positive bacteria)]OZD66800.1 ABC transporter substrate-binding protein [Rhodococcus sp. 05-340-2]OZD80877.1 ABC transporter substrate-binding protein [Rhodococcus sp. 05-340-1]
MTVNRLAAVLLVAGLLVACSANTPGAGSSDSVGPRTAVVDDPNPEPITDDPAGVLPVTVTGFDGVAVTVTDNSRIVAADQYGTLAETVFALGLGDNLVGRDTSAAFPAAENVPDVTPTGHSLSAEGILALSPTVVLTDTSIGPRAVQDQIRAAGIPVVYFDPTRTLAGVATQIEAVAAALGVPDAGADLAERTNTEISAAADATPESTEPPKIAFLYMRGPAIKMLAGPGSGADALIEALGARDAGVESGLTEQFVPVTSEALIAAAPDVILMMTKGLESIGGIEGLEQIPGIAQTPAGRERRVVDMDDGTILSFGPNTGKVLGALSKAVYDPAS